MASSKDELQRWLNTLDEDAWIGVDDDGLTLKVEGSDAYFEIGGMPEGEGE